MASLPPTHLDFRSMTLRAISLSVAVCLSATLAIGGASWAEDALPAEPAGMKSIFNGENLEHWDGDGRLWKVQDGVIRGETTTEAVADGNTFLIWTGGELGDFDLRLSFRLSNTNNSGVQYRSRRITEGVRNNWVVAGYQCEIRNENQLPNVAAFIYDERGTRGRICLVGEKATWEAEGGKQVSGKPLIDQAGFEKLFRLDDWNDLVIRAKGNHIQHYINGQLVLDFTDNDPQKTLLKGVLALQLHAGKPMWCEFKNIRLAELK